MHLIGIDLGISGARITCHNVGKRVTGSGEDDLKERTRG